MLDVTFWQERYESGNTPWDLGGPSSHFEALLAQPPAFLKPGRMAVLGCGQGHDAALFARSGFEVTGFDYAHGAIEKAGQRYGDEARFVQADVLLLGEPGSPWQAQFDYVLEHTCFCAIPLSDRPRYAEAISRLLKPGGYLVGIFWEHAEPDGPPFSTTETQLDTTFGKNFERISTENRQPVAERSGVERMIILRRNPSGV